MRILCITIMENKTDIPLLGSAYINASLKANGYYSDILIKNLKISTQSPSLIVNGINNDNVDNSSIIDAVEDIERFSPDIVCFSCYSYNHTGTSRIARELKKRNPEIILIAGGPDIIHPELKQFSFGYKIHKEQMDYIIYGEGEFRILKLVEAIIKKEPVDDIYIIDCKKSYVKCGFNSYTERIEDLNLLPFPDFGNSDIKQEMLCIPIYMSRGCTGNCSFCVRYDNFKGIRFRKGENVFKEIVYQTSKYDINSFIIVDDDPFSIPALKEVENLLYFLSSHDVKYSGYIYNARISQHLLDPKWPKLLLEAGFKSVQFGVESFSQQVRKHMGKPYLTEVVDGVLKNFYLNGLSTKIYLIYGYPTETENDFQMTVDWIKEKGHFLSHISVNNFILNDIYMDKRPGTAVLQKPFPGEPYSHWRSDFVNPDIIRERAQRLKELLDNYFPNSYWLAMPDSKYIVREPLNRGT